MDMRGVEERKGDRMSIGDVCPQESTAPLVNSAPPIAVTLRN